MAMSKRFFIKLAAEYKAAKPESDPELAVWLDMIVITANALRTQNSTFNFQRFYEACGLERVGSPTP